MAKKVGSFTVDGTTGATKQITGVGFQPQAYELEISFISADGVSTGEIRSGYGVTDGTRHGCIAIGIGDGVAASTGRRMTRSDSVLVTLDSVGNITSRFTHLSFDADGFTLTTAVTPTGGTYVVKYVAYSGLDNVYVHVFTLPTALGNFTESPLGFQPDVTKWACAASTSLNTADTIPTYSRGYAITSGTQFATIHREASGATSNYSESTAATDRVVCTIDVNGNDLNPSVSFVSHNANGFTGNRLVGTTANYVIVLCIKGGGVWGANTFALQGATGNFDVATNGIDPDAAFLFASNITTASRTTPFEGAHNAFGAVAGTDQWAVERHTFNNEPLSGSQLTEEYTASSSTRVLERHTRTAANTFTLQDDLQFISFGVQKITLNQVTTSSTAILVGILYVGPATGGGGGGDEALKRRYRHNHLGAIV